MSRAPRRPPTPRSRSVDMLTSVRPNGRGRFHVVLAALVGTVVLASAGPVSAQSPTRGGTLKVNYLEPVNLNSAIVSGTTAGVYGAQLFAGLVQLDEHFTPRPYLAERWDVSADGKTYTFHLVKDATFHD